MLESCRRPCCGVLDVVCAENALDSINAVGVHIAEFHLLAELHWAVFGG